MSGAPVGQGVGQSLNRLTAKRVASINEPGRYSDGGGLYLHVRAGGSRQWVLLYTFAGKRREMGLGSAVSVSLALARERADAARRQIASGVDPLKADEPSRIAPTFGEVAARFIEDQSPSWRSPIHRRQWRQTLDDYAGSLMAMQVDAISTEHVLACLRPIWQAKPETATRLRGRIERILDAAKASGHRSGENPALWRGHLSLILPPTRKLARGHHAAMPYEQAPAFFAALRARQAPSARMLEFVILTASRSGEARHARWAEIVNDVWIIPAERMKAHRPHRVPLVAAAIACLPPRGNDDDLIWPNSRAKAHSDMVFGALLERMGFVGITTHGFRATFKSWAEDCTDHAREIVEASLAHVIGDKAERAYRRSDALERRRALLQDWADFLGSSTGNDLK